MSTSISAPTPPSQVQEQSTTLTVIIAVLIVAVFAVLGFLIHVEVYAVAAAAVICTIWLVIRASRGRALRERPARPESRSVRDETGQAARILPLFLVCWILGFLGIHRFMVGKVGTGILMIVTLGGLGIWVLVDLIMLATGNFKDKSGAKITEWT